MSRLLAAIGIVLLPVAASCTPEEILWWENWSHRHDPTLACIRAHESDTSGGYAAENPTSSASGAYQFIDSTWRHYSTAAGYPGYGHASSAPWWIQDEVAKFVLDNGGGSAWAGSGCT